jgi:hypothetical protein
MNKNWSTVPEDEYTWFSSSRGLIYLVPQFLRIIIPGSTVPED